MDNNDLIFVTRLGRNQRTENGVDVCLTLIGKGKHIALSIARDACDMIGPGDHITTARLGDRLYIKKTDKTSGFKLQGKEHSTRMYVQIPVRTLKVNGDWVGDYRLWWNSERELFYIDNERRS